MKAGKHCGVSSALLCGCCPAEAQNQIVWKIGAFQVFVESTEQALHSWRAEIPPGKEERRFRVNKTKLTFSLQIDPLAILEKGKLYTKKSSALSTIAVCPWGAQCQIPVQMVHRAFAHQGMAGVPLGQVTCCWYLEGFALVGMDSSLCEDTAGNYAPSAFTTTDKLVEQAENSITNSQRRKGQRQGTGMNRQDPTVSSERSGILDLRIVNLDRNDGNLLVIKRGGATYIRFRSCSDNLMLACVACFSLR
eukprot:1744775-Amphidinium_carterae.1